MIRLPLSTLFSLEKIDQRMGRPAERSIEAAENGDVAPRAATADRLVANAGKKRFLFGHGRNDGNPMA